MRRPIQHDSYMLKVPGTGRGWRILLALLGLTLLLLIFFAGTKNLPKLMALTREHRKLSLQIEEVQASNQHMQRQIADLQADPRAVEPIAREELGLAAAREWVYRFIPANAPAPQKQ